MSHLWGRYDNFQIFLHVAVVAVDFDQPATPPAKLPVTKFKALLDTGAQRTAISNAVATKMGLSSTGKVRLRGVSGSHEHNSYMFKIGLFLGEVTKGDDGEVLSGDMFSLLNKEFAGTDFNSAGNFDVILGMDVISTGSLKVEGNGTFSFSF